MRKITQRELRRSSLAKSKKMKKITININGQACLYVYENGDVTLEETFPCSTAGEDFMKPITRKETVGTIGANGFEVLEESGFKGRGLYNLLERYNRSKTEYDYCPGIYRDELGRPL